MEFKLLYLVIPFISCLIGWLTNYLAIKMLFYPTKKINFFIFKLQGIIPKRKEKIAKNISKSIVENFLSKKDIEKLISKKSESFSKKLIEFIKEKIILSVPIMFKNVAKNIIEETLKNNEKKNFNFYK